MKKSGTKMICAAGVSLAVLMAAAGLGGCTSQVQVPDTIKVQNLDNAAQGITCLLYTS